MYRLGINYSAANGAATYPDADQYLFYSSSPLTARGFGNTEKTLQTANKTLWPCWYYNLDPRGIGSAPNPMRMQVIEAMPRGESAFDPEIRSSLTCEPALPGPNDRINEAGVVNLPVAFPVLLAAVDPAQEEALVGLADAVTDGRYLRHEETPVVERQHGAALAHAPFLMSSDAFSHVNVRVRLERLEAGAEDALAMNLSSSDARPWVDGLSGQPLGAHTFDLADSFASAVSPRSSLIFYRTGSGTASELDSTWTNGPVNYTLGPGERLTVAPLPDADPAVWGTPNHAEEGFDANVPVDNLATQVRAVTQATGVRCGPCTGGANFLSPKVVGRFDPGELRGFSGLSRVPMETYREPIVTGADADSRMILNEQPLHPDRNIGGYLTQPPALITTLASLDAFFNSRTGSKEQAAAPISSIRVRVAGVEGIDELSRARVAAVAAAIEQRVGRDVAVEVTLGSSPAPLQVSLPPGVYGAHPLQVHEQWAEKGVGVRILAAVDRKSALLFSLILVVCGTFVGQGALASVQSRRTEIATLGTLGWTRIQTARVVMAELVLVGIIGGLLGVTLASISRQLMDLHQPWGDVLLAFPIGMMIAVVAGIIPVIWVTRLNPVAGLRPPISAASRSTKANTLWRMALTDARRSWVRTVAGASGLCLAVTALSFLTGATLAFRGQIAGNLLGAAVVTQARPVDYISVAILFGLGAFSLVDVLLLNRRDRARDHAMLLATGWSAGEVSSLIVREAVIVGGLGGVVGATLALSLSLMTSWSSLDTGTVLHLLGATALSLFAGLVTLLLAALAPVFATVRSSPSQVLADA